MKGELFHDDYKEKLEIPFVHDFCFISLLQRGRLGGSAYTIRISSFQKATLLQSLRQAEHDDEKGARTNQRQCKAGDTVPGSMSRPRGNPTVVKIYLINKRPLDPFQRLN